MVCHWKWQLERFIPRYHYDQESSKLYKKCPRTLGRNGNADNKGQKEHFSSYYVGSSNIKYSVFLACKQLGSI